MAFIDTSETMIGVAITQIAARYSQPGQPVEITFKFMPRVIYIGRVQSVLQAISTAQI
jgi:multidrug resistance efflux pump